MDVMKGELGKGMEILQLAIQSAPSFSSTDGAQQYPNVQSGHWARCTAAEGEMRRVKKARRPRGVSWSWSCILRSLVYLFICGGAGIVSEGWGGSLVLGRIVRWLRLLFVGKFFCGFIEFLGWWNCEVDFLMVQF